MLLAGCQLQIQNTLWSPEVASWKAAALGPLPAEEPAVEDAAAAPVAPLDPNLPLRLIGHASDAPRPLSLREALLAAFQSSDVIRASAGTTTTIAATNFDPQILQEQSNVAAAKFDPLISVGYLGSHINNPPNSFFGPGIPQQTRRDEGNLTATLTKPWATGGTTSVGYLPPLGYLFYPGSAALLNPIYNSDVVFQAQQPLLRGGGIGVNVAPIQITQLQQEQSTWDVKQATMAEVRSIEETYWGLQAAHAVLQAIEGMLKLVDDAVRIERLRHDSQLVTTAELARVELQRNQFLQQRVQATLDVTNRQYQLRNLMGIARQDGAILVPIDPPVRQPPAIDVEASVATAMENRPDLIKQRLAVRIREMQLAVARNGVLPQFDLIALYRANGLGKDLNTALNQLSTFTYTDWTLGVNFSVPLGNRAPRAAFRASELALAKDMAVLRQNQETLSFQLTQLSKEIRAAWDSFTLAQQNVRESQEWVRVGSIRFSNPPPAGSGQDWLLVALNDYQLALRNHIDAVTDASQRLAQYNTLLARYEEMKGTLLESRQVLLANDPVKAVQDSGMYSNYRSAAAPPPPPPRMLPPASAANAVVAPDD